MNFEKYIINSNQSIRNAIKKMDIEDVYILIAIHPIKKNVLGIFTIGDFRKFVLKGVDINTNLSKIINKDFIYVKNDKINNRAIKQLFKKNKNIDLIPVLNSRHLLIGLLHRSSYENDKNTKNNISVVIMAGGFGERLMPITKILPKALVPIGGKPIIEIIIDRFFRQNFKKFIISINKDFKIIKTYLGNNYLKSKLTYISEDKRMGTIGALKLIKNIEKTFILSNCDIIIKGSYSKILEFHKINNNKLTIVSAMKNISLPYGVCELYKNGNLKAIREKPEFNYLINTGFYVFESSIIKLIDNKAPYNIDDLIKKLLKNKLKVGVYPISEKSWLDIGEPDKLLESEKNIKYL